MLVQTVILSCSGILLGVVQSTLLENIIPMNIVPDIALIMLIAAAWRYGSLTGEVSGFLIGLGFDAMSLAPLGFHAFLFGLIGYLFGRMQDNIAPGPIFFPAVAALIATIIKYSGSYILSLVFGMNSGAIRYFSLDAVWELLINILFAPLVFFLVTLVGRLSESRRGGFR